MSTYTDWLAAFHRDKGYHPLGDVIFDAGVAEGLRRAAPAGAPDAEPAITDDAALDWARRNDLDYLNPRRAKCAIEDARSLHLLDAAPTQSMQQPDAGELMSDDVIRGQAELAVSNGECAAQVKMPAGEPREAMVRNVAARMKELLRLAHGAPVPSPQVAQGEESTIKAAYIRVFGSDTGWLDVQGNYFITGFQAADLSEQSSAKHKRLSACAGLEEELRQVSEQRDSLDVKCAELETENDRLKSMSAIEVDLPRIPNLAAEPAANFAPNSLVVPVSEVVFRMQEYALAAIALNTTATGAQGDTMDAARYRALFDDTWPGIIKPFGITISTEPSIWATKPEADAAIDAAHSEEKS